MRIGRVRLVSFLACLGMAVTAFAQFGHPLSGTWSGDWGPTKDKRDRLLVQMHYNGKQVTGTINPGASALTLKTVTVVPGPEDNPGVWDIKMEADGKDASGKAVTVLVDGKLTNLGSPNRVLTGTWNQGGVKGDFKLTRN
jgi:hypothetical protein